MTPPGKLFPIIRVFEPPPPMSGLPLAMVNPEMTTLFAEIHIAVGPTMMDEPKRGAAESMSLIIVSLAFSPISTSVLSIVNECSK